jgi:hypothetical protein
LVNSITKIVNATFLKNTLILGFTLTFLLVSTHFTKLCKLALTNLAAKPGA